MAEASQNFGFSIFGRRFGMNATWVNRFVISALGCAVTASTAAMAGSIPVNVDFSCSDGQGVKSAGGGALCTGSRLNGPAGLTSISSWTQAFVGAANYGPGTIN